MYALLHPDALAFIPESGLKTFVDPADTGCGPIPETQGPFSCPADQRIYLNIPVVNGLDDRDFILGMVIAHEWGHHLETVIGYQTTALPSQGREVYSVQVELAADRLAGVWAASAYLEGGANEAELYDALVTIANLGDGVGSPLLPTDAHGSPQQRHDAVAGGLWYGDPLLCQQTYLGE